MLFILGGEGWGVFCEKCHGIVLIAQVLDFSRQSGGFILLAIAFLIHPESEACLRFPVMFFGRGVRCSVHSEVNSAGSNGAVMRLCACARLCIGRLRCGEVLRVQGNKNATW